MAVNYCKPDLFNSKALNALKRIVGADENLLYSVVSECISYDKFTEGFTEYYKNDTKQDPDFDAGNGVKMANRMLAYYKKNHPRLEDTVRTRASNDKVTEFGYDSILDREEGKEHMATSVLTMFTNIQQLGINIKGNPIDYYKSRLIALSESNVIKRLAEVTGENIDTLKTEIEEADDRTAYLRNKFGDNIDVTSRNLLAIYQELHASPRTIAQYIDELFCNPVLQPVFAENKDALESFNENVADTDAATGNVQGKEAYVVEVDDTDRFIAQANSHAGLHSDYMKHVSMRVRTYFDTLPKLSSKEKVTNSKGEKEWMYDKNNRFGLMSAMGAERCSAMLYGGSSNYNSIPSMIAYIERIGNTIKGFEAFCKFAEDLRNDPDFAYEVFTVYAKTVMEKVQVVVNSGETVVRVANNRANKHRAFIFNLMNDIKGTAIDTDVAWMENQVNNLSGSVNRLERDLADLNSPKIAKSDKKKIEDTKNARFNNILSDIIRLVKIYYPSIDDNAIISYIEMNRGAGNDVPTKLKNVKRLLGVVESTRKASIDTNVKYTARAAKIREYLSDNAIIDRDVNNGKFRSFADYHPMEEVYAIDYISQDQKKAYIELCNMLIPYSVVKLQLTAPNVMGNNQSSVMNNSFITNLKKLLDASYMEDIVNEDGEVVGSRKRNIALEHWGAEKLKDPRYRGSTILLEHVDEATGEKINEGIFRYDRDGQLVLTEDGPRLLDVSLFDGSSDMDKGSNVQYQTMTQGSFFPTAFLQFFKTEQVEGASVKVARYFPRIPSDSTTMFSIQGPRYDTSDLYRIKNPAELDRIAEEALSTIPIVDIAKLKEEIAAGTTDMTLEDARANYNVKEPLPLIVEKQSDRNNKDAEIATLAQYILGKGEIKVYQGTMGYNARFAKEPGTSNQYRIKIQYGDNMYVFVGRKAKHGRLDVLQNPKLKAIMPIKGDGSMPIELQEYLKSNLKSRLSRGNINFNGRRYNQPELEINRDSRIVKLYKQQFKQELIEIAVALDHYFPMEEDGWIADGDRHQEESKKIIKTRTDEFNTRGYNFYHLGKDGKVLSKKGDKYTLNGAAFHSSKFTLSTTDENGNEVKRNYLDDVITTDMNELGSDNRPVSDGRIHLLYGGDGMDSYLHVVRDKNSEEERKPIIDVTLTQEQDELVTDKIVEYLSDYIEQCQEYANRNANFVKNVDVNHSTIVEYFVNHNIFLMQCDDLLDGSSKFYKNSQTILKRSKEYEGSGVPYGLVDYLDEDSDNSITDNSYLNSGSFQQTQFVTKDLGNGKTRREKVTVAKNIQEFFKEKGLHDCRQKKKFTGVTVANTKSTNTQLLKELANQLHKEAGIDKGLAEDILFGPVKRDENGVIQTVDGTPNGEPIREGGFQETKVNDAQSYITMEEWIRRIAARGQLKRYMPLIQKLLDENAKLTAADLKEFVQVQKNFYYDLHYDEEFGIEVPRQIKNAEFVLIPRFIRGTQLAKVYDLMIAAGVDQLNTLETSKAANKDVLTLWDNEGELVGADSFVKEASTKLQTYDYRYLYTQQETPQHMNSTNKAGIQIVKKIIDNIDEKSPLYARKHEYMQLFVQNIRDSYDSLINELEIEFDEDNNITHFNREVFYNKLKDELRRLGLDSNLIDYVTLDENGVPRMPAHMNNVITKLESVVQAMFNSSITRQRLPGFHAAQVTNVGWRSMGERVTGVAYDKDLKYHPDAYRSIEDESKTITEKQYKALSEEDKKKYKKSKASYIEVMLPASVFGINKKSKHYANMTDEEIIAELEADGLDIVMGYRIPTEGKQSVCNMKVVGFVDDAYGSTIIVPNEWVAQTGSDFDIDSVYGINYETYRDKDGKVCKVKYFNENSDVTLADYRRYVNEEARRILSRERRTESNDAIKGLNKARNERFRQLNAEQDEQFDKINKVLPTVINNIKRNIAAVKDSMAKTQPHLLEPEYKAEYNKLLIETRRGTVQGILDAYRNNATVVELLTPYKEVLDKLYSFFDEELIDYENDKLEEIEKLANAAGLESFESYKKALKTDPISANSRAARNNRILDNMKDILNHPSSLEENLSRSNFDDIIYWRDKVMNDNVKKARDNRSSYNPIDQFRYQEDAMSGATLKGFSVSLDTFCSVCNTVRPTLGRPIYIVYDSSDFTDIKGISRRFNQVKTTEKGKTFSIRHDSYGWSNDNRAVNGKLLTAHSSQTTAHILDAIKEGAIPGVNEFTFGAYKTFLNIGSDYKTAISFIMQPGVDRVVQAYNANNSVFSNSHENPVHQAIKSIAQDLVKAAREAGREVEDINTRDSIVSILAQLNKVFGKEFNAIFHQDGDDDLKINLTEKNLANLPIVVPQLYNRLKGEGEFKNTSPVKEMLFDLGVILAFHRVNKIARDCTGIAQCCNPDKFGAKQTVFETNKVFDDIRDAVNADNTGEEDKRDPILFVNGKDGSKKHILLSIYPGCDQGTDENPAAGVIAHEDVMDSSYPTLYAYLKYATATSTIVAKDMFVTQSLPFVRCVKGITSVMSGFRPRLDEATYTDVQKYILSYYYNDIESIKHPIRMIKDEQGYIPDIVLGQIKEVDGKQIVAADPKEGSALDERTRIFGFNCSPNISFEVEDINDPTQDELDDFARLSPAQKVSWLQKNLRNSSNTIFGLLDVSLYNDKRRARRMGMQTIEYRDENINPNVVYGEFYKAFYNDNTFIQMAAIDLIKYAVVVEGLRMSSTGITKIISNDPLLEDFGIDGIGFIGALNMRIANIGKHGSISEDSTSRLIYERYLRSHPDCPNIRKLYMNKANEDKYKFKIGTYGIVHSRIDTPTDEIDADTAKKNWYERLREAGIVTHNPAGETIDAQYSFNSYIRIIRGARNVLYKIRQTNDGVVLYPLTPLEANETSKYSAKPENNKHYPPAEVYEKLIQNFEARDESTTFDQATLVEIVNDLQATGQWEMYEQPKQPKYVEAAPFDVNEIESVAGQIRDHFENTNENLYIKSDALTNYIFTADPLYGSTQYVKMKDGTVRQFIIQKVNDKAYKEKYLKKYKNSNIYVLKDSDFYRLLETESNPQIKEAIKQARETHLSTISNLFMVTPVVQTMNASHEESDSDILSFMRVEARNDNELAVEGLNAIKFNGVEATETSVTENTISIMRAKAKFIKLEAQTLATDFEHFVEDPFTPGNWLAMNDDRVQPLLQGNAKLLERYQKLINTALGFLNSTEIYKTYDESGEDLEMDHYISDIKKAINQVSDLGIIDAANKLADGYYTQLSTNPLIKTQLIKIMDGYYKTYGSMWMFNDIMEAGNPLIQTGLRDVMGNLEAKRLALRRTMAEYHKKRDAIIKEAEANGKKVDLDKCIDADGKRKQAFTKEFEDKITELRSNMLTAAENYGMGSVEHLQAKLEFDIFKAKYVNQEVVPEYYIDRARWDKTILDKFPKLFSKYKKLKYEQADIYSYTDGELSDEARKRLDEIDRELHDLLNPHIYKTEEGSHAIRPETTSPDSDIFGKDAIMYLQAYVDADIERRQKYFEYSGAYGFDELVAKNRAIIISYENRDANGIPEKPINVLMRDPVYAAAKNWLADNAYFKLNPSQFDRDNKDSIYNKLQNALKYLKLNSGGKSRILSSIVKSAKTLNDRNVRDEHGIVDGRLLAPIERATLKSSSRDGYLMPLADGTDRRLISSAPANSQQYRREFWAHISPNVTFKPTPLEDTPGNHNRWLDEANAGKTILDYRDWLVWMGSEPKRNYYDIVTKINNLLEPYYRHSDGVVHFDDVPDTPEGVATLKQLAELYQQLRNIESGDMTEEQEKARKEWMDENVDYEVNKVAYLAQAAAMREKTPEWQEAWKLVNLERKKDGKFVVTGEGKVVPNRRLYSILKAKGEPGTEQHDQWVDKKLSEAINMVNTYYTKTETVYYKQAQAEAINRAKADPSFSYEQWYRDNHVYNPYTRRYEPLDCWVTTEFNEKALEDIDLHGEWIPKGQQRQNKIKDGDVNGVYVRSQDMRNKNYKEGVGLAQNYAGVNLIDGTRDTQYRNPIELNEYEERMLKLIEEELVKTGRNTAQREHWAAGWMPIEKVHKKSMGKRIATEAGKFIGLSIDKKQAERKQHNDLDYVKDELPPMPMSQLIRDTDLGTVDFNRIEPQKYTYVKNGVFDREAYNKDHKEWEDAKTEALEKNREVHRALLNRDWYTVIDHYLERASEYNAVQDNKHKLYYMRNMLMQQKVYLREHDLYGNLKKIDDNRTHGEDKVYETTTDDSLLKQYEVLMQRLLFGQWKDDEGFLTDLGTRLQGGTSASYMMLNIRGGISNVTLGATGIFADAIGRELFGFKNWMFGTNEWRKGLIGMGRAMYKDISYNVQDAIIKYFKVVDYDEIAGVSTEFDMEKFSERVRNAMFSPQTIGEHFMQNSVLFAMLRSHKIVDIENDALGIGKTYMSEKEYINYRLGQELNDILTEEQQEEFAKWKKEVKSDKDKLSEYAWWRRDILTDFVYLHCHKSNKAKQEGRKNLTAEEIRANRVDHNAQINKFLKDREKLTNKFKEEFAQLEDMYSQCELGSDSKLSFKEGSVLHDLSQQFVAGENVTATEALLGRFTERVRKVNNRIHGIYNRMGRAYIEKRWFGSLIMQYHKHLPIGLLKRYRTRGYFNETRGTTDKGMLASIFDFLSLNADKVKIDYGWTEDNVNAVKSVQFMLAHSLAYIAQIKTTWNIVPEYERANIKRNLGDLVGVLAGLLTVIGLIAYDDDDNDSLLYNLWLYEGQRLADEAFLYNPLGLWTETKTLMSTPVAAQSIISDIIKAVINIANYDETFQTGRFAGQNKLKVYLTRRIPGYGGIRSLLSLPDSNRYYKIGDTASTIVPTRPIGEWIGDIFR